jgi:hypothetical protein
MSFNSIFSEEKVQIDKNCVNTVYVKLNYASNGVKIIYYFLQSMNFSLPISHFLFFLEKQSELEYFILHKI